MLTTSKAKAELFATQFFLYCTLDDQIDKPMPSITVAPIISLTSSSRSNGSAKFFWLLPIINIVGLMILEHLYWGNNLLQRYFSGSLKGARVQSVSKKDFESICSNYRPISLFPVIIKVMELTMPSTILKCLESNKLTHERQYGVRRERSKADLLTCFNHRWMEFHSESQVSGLDFLTNLLWQKFL